ncbi:MAG: ATP synthase F1 subunit delta [Pontimonas sp.]
MGAQTTQSLVEARSSLEGYPATSELASSLFAAALGLSGSKALRGALADSSVDQKALQALAASAFASLSTDAKKLIGSLVSLPWSAPEDLQAALEELGIRMLAQVAGESDLVGELLAIQALIHSDPEVELAVGSKRASAEAKATLVSALVGGKVSPEAEAIVRHLVSDSRGRRIGRMLSDAAEIVADQGGKGLAVVTVATSLSSAQQAHIEKLLEKQYQRPHYIAQRVDDSVVGGARIRVGDDVIDGSVATRLQDLRMKLAG